MTTNDLSVFWCINALLAFSHPRETDFDKTASFLRASSTGGNIQDKFTYMALQTHPIIASYKRQLKCGSCAKMGHSTKSYSLNFEIV